MAEMHRLTYEASGIDPTPLRPLLSVEAFLYSSLALAL